MLERKGFISSMSRKGNCYDNATMESFWSTLKAEVVPHKGFECLAQARMILFEYIECFYNRNRLHSALGYQSPVEYEQYYYKQAALASVSTKSG
jgi:transposase InsO family protein